MATFCYLTLSYLNVAHRTKAIPSFRLTHELDQVSKAGRACIWWPGISLSPLLQSSFGWSVSLTLSWMQCLGSGHPHVHPCSGKKENLTIISDPFSGSLVHSGWKRTATGLQPSVLQKPGGSWCYACTPPVWHFALAWQQQTSSQMFKKVLPKVLGVDPQ